MANTVVLVTNEERAARQDCVEQALASVRIEGLEPDEETKAIAERYVDGELTIWQMGEEIRAANARKYGSVHVPRD